jgi:hypothetical protein
MALQKLQFKPGIVRDTTDYTNEGGWFDCDKVRFRMGLPETIGGWAKFTSSTMLGTCRSLHVWSTLTGTNYVGAGTSKKFYVIGGDVPYDITPIRLTTTGTATFTATDGSSTLSITDVAHGAYLGDFVIYSNATTLGGNITALVLNQEYEITNVVDDDTYEINVVVLADASDIGDGGAATVAAYQINIGLDTVVVGSGWSAGFWGRGTWSSAADVSVPGANLRLWSQDNFGENLVFNVRSGGIYYWTVSSGVTSRGVNITSLTNQSAPVIANQVLVSERDRHVVAFGCDPESNPGVQDPLIIRFSSQESVTDWKPVQIILLVNFVSAQEVTLLVQYKPNNKLSYSQI